MSGDPAERRYSDEELRRILEDAAQSDVRRDAGAHAPDGHTLAEIRAIAGEVGIDPAAVDRAAANLGFSRTVPGSSTPWHGFTRLLQEEHVIPRPLTNAEMRLVALHAERVMRRRGALRDTGRLVEWRDAKDRLWVGVARDQSQTRIRAIADNSRELLAGGGLIGLVGAWNLPVVAGLDPLQGTVAGLLIGGATFGLINLYWRWRGSVTRAYLHELLDILEGAVRGT